MLKVVTMVDKKIVKTVKFDERKDDDAVNKALVECDRAIWYRDENKPEGFLVALIQNDRILRFACDGDWDTPRRSIYE